jgi:hypothetical protein
VLLTRDPIGPALFIHPARILTRAPVASMYTWPISIGGSLLCTGRQLFSLQKVKKHLINYSAWKVTKPPVSTVDGTWKFPHILMHTVYLAYRYISTIISVRHTF